jgi:sulfane dehydrogenase subunit SoxC
MVPGFEGIFHTKYIRRIKIVDRYYMNYNDYGHMDQDAKVAALDYQIGPKSVITFPSGGQKLPAHGMYELTGIAWSGRGRIERVEVTTDGGRNWVPGTLQEPRLPIALTRFRLPWRFDGRETAIASRAIDETDYVQPTREDLIAVRGTNSAYHFNGIKFWKVRADGTVTNVEG